MARFGSDPSEKGRCTLSVSPPRREDTAECESRFSTYKAQSEHFFFLHPTFFLSPIFLGTVLVLLIHRPTNFKTHSLNMRSPVIAFSIFAAAAVSPTLVSAAPSNVAGRAIAPPGLPVAVPAALPNTNSQRQHDGGDKSHGRNRRALDGNTAGGNAYSGGTSDSTGGSVVNESEDDPDATVSNNMASTYGVHT